MKAEVSKDLNDSANDFKHVVWPQIKHWCQDGEIIPMETVTDSNFAKRLDMLAGIDAWQVVSGKGIRGVASRVQYQYKMVFDPKAKRMVEKKQFTKPYASFTVRKMRSSGAETEWAKRIRAIDDPGNWLAPSLIIQAYLDRRGGRLLAAFMVENNKMFEFAKSDFENSVYEIKPNRYDGNLMAIFWVKWLEQYSVKVKQFVQDGINCMHPNKDPQYPF